MSDSESVSSYESDSHLYLESGSYDEKTGTWQKPISVREKEAYKALTRDGTTSNPRILTLHEIADYTEYSGGGLEIHVEYHPNGDLWGHLLEKEHPLATRIDWAVEIAEGIAYLHSNSVVWADPHFGNVLVTKDSHVVLADFGCSIVNPDRFHIFTSIPPPVFACPIGYYGGLPTRVDIFGFGVMLFALLINRLPWMTDLHPYPAQQLQEAVAKHENKEFDTLRDSELDEIFGPILTKCFESQPMYPSGTELVDELKRAREIWQSRQSRAATTAGI
ncbi:kinase-like domain-containing protein [Mycena epipterygia]|nr:kinase-like domain-containing protein [Mycena epipterygia]